MNTRINKRIKVTLASVAILTASIITPVSVFAEEASVVTKEVNNETIDSEESRSEESQVDSEALSNLERMAETPEQKQIVESLRNQSVPTVSPYANGYDSKITSITSIAKPNRKATEFSLKFNQNANPKNAYDGSLTGHIYIPLDGRLNGSNWLIPNGPEFISDYENGNIGLRVNFTLPEGMDAKELVKTIDWDKSNEGMDGFYDISWLGLPLPIRAKIGATWDKETVQYSNVKNEFSLALRSIKKSEVSSEKWNQYDPANTYFALTAAGILHSGTGKGGVNGNLFFDFSKYKGNSDDLSKGRELTSGKLAPAKNGDFKITANFIDRSGLIAGSEGINNLSKAVIEPGKEHINPYDSSHIRTWDSYISPWDNEKKYNVDSFETPEISGVDTVLPGTSIFNRDLVTLGEDFNSFSNTRFDRVINYFDKTDVTNGHIGNIDDITISHSPAKVPNGIKTELKYTGQVEYSDGKTSELLPASLNVTNNSKPATEGSIRANDFTIGDSNITGTYTGDVAKLRLYINGVSVAWGGMVENGKFTFYAANQRISTTDVVTMNAYDKDDNLLQENAPVKVNSPSVSGSISPAEYTIGDTEITGSYMGDIAKARVTINGKAQAWGGTFSNGRFTYYIGAGKIKAGDTVTITAYDKNDKVLDANKPVKIKSAATQGTISPAEYSVGDTEITGSYTGDVAKARVTINGKAQAWGGSFNNGRFTYYIGNGKIKAGDTVTITAYDKSDKVLDANKTVQIKAIVQATITPSVYNVGETTIKGSYTGDIVRARVLINGNPQAWGGTFSGGSFSYYIGAGKIKAGDNVKIVGYSADNSELTTKVVTVQP